LHEDRQQSPLIWPGSSASFGASTQALLTQTESLQSPGTLSEQPSSIGSQVPAWHTP
jgi:hypothetical protein